MHSINNSELIETLKGLTEIQRLDIARLLHPNIKFTTHESIYPWCGYDLVGVEKSNGVYRHMVQIDFSEHESLVRNRFRYYVDLYEYAAGDFELNAILKYLTTINPLIQNNNPSNIWIRGVIGSLFKFNSDVHQNPKKNYLGFRI